MSQYFKSTLLVYFRAANCEILEPFNETKDGLSHSFIFDDFDEIGDFYTFGILMTLSGTFDVKPHKTRQFPPDRLVPFLPGTDKFPINP